MKLSYFKYPGRAEPTRLCFVIGNCNFEDERLDSATFLEKRANGDFPTGSVPTLQLNNGKTYCQSNAILRFAGQITGMYPEDHEEALKVDEVLDSCEEIFALISPTMKIENREARMEAGKVFMENVLRKFGKALNIWCQGGHVIPNKLTVADLAVWNLVGFLSNGRLDHIPADFFASIAPNCMLVHDNVMLHPKVQMYYGNRKCCKRAVGGQVAHEARLNNELRSQTA